MVLINILKSFDFSYYVFGKLPATVVPHPPFHVFDMYLPHFPNFFPLLFKEHFSNEIRICVANCLKDHFIRGILAAIHFEGFLK